MHVAKIQSAGKKCLFMKLTGRKGRISSPTNGIDCKILEKGIGNKWVCCKSTLHMNPPCTGEKNNFS